MDQRDCELEVVRVLQALLALPVGLCGEQVVQEVGGVWDDGHDGGLPPQVTAAMDEMDRSSLVRLVVEAVWRLREQGVG